jgi:hypothetical protein
VYHLTPGSYLDLLRWWSDARETTPPDAAETLREALARLSELRLLSQICEFEHALRACDDAALAEEVRSLVCKIADTAFEIADEERARYLDDQRRCLSEQYVEPGAETIINAAAAVARILAKSFDDLEEDSYAKVQARANRLIDTIPQILQIIDQAME